MVKEWVCGQLDGKAVKEFEITADGLSARIMEYGATIHHLSYHGIDCIAGYDDLAGYSTGSSFQGATIGRYANRIGGAAFALQDETYTVDANDNQVNSLHGGREGFHKKLFTGEIVSDDSVAFTLFSPHGEGGYPGNLTLTVTFTVENDGLTITYDALSDRDTVMNFTNHTYFHLGSKNILTTKLCIQSDAITPVDAMLIPTGERMDVTGTPFDFRVPKAIGADMNADHPQLRLGGGYDHNYILGETKEYRENVITAYCEENGLILTCSTDLPGVQLYTGNVLNEPVGKGGTPLTKYYAFCLETQFFPDTPNQPSFPSCLVKAEEAFTSVTRYAFSKQSVETP